MACDPKLAKSLSHIASCHTASLPGGRRKLFAGRRHLGFVTPAFGARLAGITPGTEIAGDAVVLPEAALPRLNEIALAAGIAPRGEDFDVRETPAGPSLGLLDRGALPRFGVIGIGVHLNGLVERDGWHLWVARRAASKKLDPGKLDNLVAGGVPAGLTPFETLVKEAAEEAALPAALVGQARQVGRFSYNMEHPEGLRRDVVFAYDLVLPEDFIPSPADGEVESFALWPLKRVLEAVRETEDFKFNVNLVLIDLLIRHGHFPAGEAATLRAALNSQ